MTKFEDIFAAFGGPARYADAIGIRDFHAQTMRQRGSIPPAYWSDTVEAAGRLAGNEADDERREKLKSITLEKLAEIAKAKRVEAERVA